GRGAAALRRLERAGRGCGEEPHRRTRAREPRPHRRWQRRRGGAADVRERRPSPPVRAADTREAHRHAGSDPAGSRARGRRPRLAANEVSGGRVRHGLTVAAPLSPTLSRLHGDFERAADASGQLVDVNLRIAGRHVSIRFAGDAAADALTPAFAHLEGDEPGPPALTLFVWDGMKPDFASSLPEPDAAARTTGAGPSYYAEEGDFRALRQPADAFSVLTAAADRGWFWTPDTQRLPYWDYTAPF